jgi:hypothetical protein
VNDLVGRCFIGISLRKQKDAVWELSLVFEWLEDTCIPSICIRVVGEVKNLIFYMTKAGENLYKKITSSSKTPSNLLVLRFTKGGILSLPLTKTELVGFD